jgi:hypothetical protein
MFSIDLFLVVKLSFQCRHLRYIVLCSSRLDLGLVRCGKARVPQIHDISLPFTTIRTAVYRLIIRV